MVMLKHSNSVMSKSSGDVATLTVLAESVFLTQSKF